MSDLFSAASLNYLKPMEYSCYHLLNFDEFLSLKHLKNVETSEVRNKVEELVEVLVDTALFIIFLALDWCGVEWSCY